MKMSKTTTEQTFIEYFDDLHRIIILDACNEVTKWNTLHQPDADQLYLIGLGHTIKDLFENPNISSSNMLNTSHMSKLITQLMYTYLEILIDLFNDEYELDPNGLTYGTNDYMIDLNNRKICCREILDQLIDLD